MFQWLLSAQTTVWKLLLTYVRSFFLTSCQALRSVLQQCLYRGCKTTPSLLQPANQKERRAICAGSCLVTCQQRRKTNRGMGGAMNSRPAMAQCYGNIQRLAWARKDHFVILCLMSAIGKTKCLYCTCIHAVRAGWAQLVQCCSAHYVTCFAEPLHQNISHTEIQAAHSQLHIPTLST